MAYYRLRGILTFKWPLQNGVCNNWDDWEKVLHNVFYNELRIAPEEQALTVVIKPTMWSQKVQLEKVYQLYYETFNVPALCVFPSDVVTLHQVSVIEKRNMLTGCVLSSGDGTCVSCVWEGAPLSYTLVADESKGTRAVKDSFQELLTAQNKSVHEKKREEYQNTLLFCIPFEPKQFKAQAEQESVRKTIAKMVALNDLPLDDPDVSAIELDHELYLPCEVLFEGANNLAQMIVQSIDKAPIDLQQQMYDNIVLEGKNTLYPGFTSRINWELGRLVDRPFTIRSYSCRGEIAWQGASLISASALSYLDEKQLKNLFVEIAEYDEQGPTPLARRAIQNCPPLPAKFYEEIFQ